MWFVSSVSCHTSNLVTPFALADSRLGGIGLFSFSHFCLHFNLAINDTDRCWKRIWRASSNNTLRLINQSRTCGAFRKLSQSPWFHRDDISTITMMRHHPDFNLFGNLPIWLGHVVHLLSSLVYCLLACKMVMRIRRDSFKIGTDVQ